MTNKRTFLSRIEDNPYFFVPYFIFLIIGAVILLTTGKGDSLIFINSYHNLFLDRYFVFWTTFGEGIWYLTILIPLMFFRIGHLINGLILYLSSGLFAQILKNIFDIPRPIKYFGNNIQLYLVPGLDIYSYNSFPSGHATSGFTMLLFFAMITKNKTAGLFYFFCALSIAMSRVYLVQHFLVDIYFGSLLGTITTIIVFNYLENSEKLSNSGWFNYRILKLNNYKFRTPDAHR
jgi:membrane-associated phospholipid phosphatase